MMNWRVAFPILFAFSSPGSGLGLDSAFTADATAFSRLAVVDYSIKAQLNAGAPKDCVLRTDVMEALARAQQAAKLTGFTLKVLECYRPFSSTPKMPEEDRRALARGNVVEVIFAEPGGGPTMLPRPHDQAIILSSKQYTKKEAKRNQTKLHELLAKEGFQPETTRWWRFTYAAAADLKINDFAVNEVPRRERKDQETRGVNQIQ